MSQTTLDDELFDEAAGELRGDVEAALDEARAALPDVPVSLSEQLMAGVSDFKEMGMHDAYAGSPSSATAEEGEELLALLAEMIIAEVAESLAE